MKKSILTAVVALLLVGGAVGDAFCGSRIGGGIHYLNTLGDIKDNPEFDEHALGIMFSYQYAMPLLKIEGDVEWIPDYGGSDKSMWQPQAWVLIGSLIYGGGGIGIGYIDGEWQSDPFYGLRLGVDLGLGRIDLDAYATYRFQSTEVFKDLGSQDLDSITFGAMIRFSI
jgi:hypothetical protein